MPISTLSGYDASVASGAVEELEFKLPIEVPKSKSDNAYSINVHAIEFYSSEFPATTKMQKWSLRRNSMSTPAIKYEATDGAVIGALSEYLAVEALQSTIFRRKEYKIPHNVLATSLWLEMTHDKGSAIEMGARIEFTFKKINAETWLWAQNLTI